MVVLKLKTGEGEVFRFRLEQCDLKEVQQRIACTSCTSQHPVVIAKDQTVRPLTEESLQAALADAEDAIIRVEFREQAETAKSPQNDVAIVTAIENPETLPSSAAPGADMEVVEAEALEPSAPPLTGVWHAEGQVLQDPPQEPLQGHVLQMPQAPQAPQAPEAPQAPQASQMPHMPQMPQAPQAQLEQNLHEIPQLLGQLITNHWQQATQNLPDHIHQHLDRAREHVQRHVRQLHEDAQTRHREMHQQMHRHCAEMHRRVHGRHGHHGHGHHGHGHHGYAHGNQQRSQNAGREDQTHWANTMNVQPEVMPMYTHPLEMHQQRRHIARGMITGYIRLHDSDLVLEDCMVTGALHLSGSSRVLLRGGMLTGSVMRSSGSSFENQNAMVTGQVVEI